MVSVIWVYFSANLQFGGLRIYVLKLKQLVLLGPMNDLLTEAWGGGGTHCNVLGSDAARHSGESMGPLIYMLCDLDRRSNLSGPAASSFIKWGYYCSPHMDNAWHIVAAQ